MKQKSVFKNPLLKAQKSSRNGFDIGHKRGFHAALGQLLPVFHADVPAGSYIELGEENQTYNLNPIIRPAFTRIKEHIDYFAVPKVQLWSLYDNFITGQSQYMSSALGLSFVGQAHSEEVPIHVPVFDGKFLTEVLENKYNASNPFGLSEMPDTLKLLDLLGYGNFYAKLKDSGDYQDVNNACSAYISPYYLPQNFFNLLAYQKIYYSYYRNSKYEGNVSTAYNMDWLTKGKLYLSENDYFNNVNNFKDIFTLHYRWLKKDYFMNSNPSVLPTNSDIGFTGLSGLLQEGTNATSNFWQLFSLPGGNLGTRGGVVTNNGTSDISNNKGEFTQLKGSFAPSSGSQANSTFNSVSQIRFAFAFDKLLRRMRSAGATFDDQMLAQFGIKPVDMRHGDAYYLGGFTNRLNVSEVTQTTDLANGGLGQFGANISKYSTNSSKIKYHAKEDCIIMGIYSTSIDIDYNSSRYERDNLKRYRFDFYNPAFENLGLQALYQGELSYNSDQTSPSELKETAIVSKQVATNLLSFGKRYLEYKTKLDVVNGLLDYSNNNASVMPWTTQYCNLSYNNLGVKITHNNEVLSKPAMLVNPLLMDYICTTNWVGKWENDHFLVNLYNDAKLIANMSVEGEVY